MNMANFIIIKSVNIIFSQHQKMDFGSKISESKEYTSNVLRENYNSNNSSKFSTPSQIVDEIRKKYDTPTRREIKQFTSRPNYDKQSVHLDPQLKKSVNSTTLGQGSSIRDRWAGQMPNKNYEPSPSYTKENIAGQQQTIFRKIKEMKDSLLNKNEKIKTTKSIYEPRATQKLQSRVPMLNDNRVENIDKINIKIQQILSCLKQTENKNGTSESQYKQSKPTSKAYEVSTRGSHNYSKVNERQTKSYQYNQQGRQSFENKMEVKNTNSIYQQDKKYKIASPAPKNVQNFELSSNRGENSKVRSFISSIQKQTGGIATGGKYEMRSGKKLDDQISKIQSKIHQFQEQKRRLNIDFKPYSYSNSKSTIDLAKRSYTLDKNQRPITKFEPAKASQNTKKVEQFSYVSRAQKAGGYEKYLQKSTEERYSARMSFEPSLKQKKTQITREQNIQAASINVQLSKRQGNQENSSLFKIKLIPVDQQKSSASSRIQTRLLSEDLRRKADQGIQDRKKRLITDQPSKLRPTIKKLVEKLSEQTKLDQKLRNDKLYFESNLENKKWQTLAENLSKKGIRLTAEKMEKIFKITDQQNNPFFSVRESQSSLEMLATSYAASQDHWNRQIYKRFSRQDLKNEDFTANTLDLQKKGYIVLEDIVRFLNMETGTFYRNRDLFLIFRKVSQQQKITFDELLNTICK